MSATYATSALLQELPSRGFEPEAVTRLGEGPFRFHVLLEAPMGAGGDAASGNLYLSDEQFTFELDSHP